MYRRPRTLLIQQRVRAQALKSIDEVKHGRRYWWRDRAYNEQQVYKYHRFKVGEESFSLREVWTIELTEKEVYWDHAKYYHRCAQHRYGRDHDYSEYRVMRDRLRRNADFSFDWEDWCEAMEPWSLYDDEPEYDEYIYDFDDYLGDLWDEDPDPYMHGEWVEDCRWVKLPLDANNMVQLWELIIEKVEDEQIQ